MSRVGQNHRYKIYVYIRYFCREVTKYTVIYGVYLQFWPTLQMRQIYADVCAETNLCNVYACACVHT